MMKEEKREDVVMNQAVGNVASLPVNFSPEGNLRRYLSEIKQFPMLAEEEEYMLAKAWQEQGDVEAARKLVTSHLRLVARIAFKYKGYGLPVGDLIAEGNIGVMQALQKFAPDKGFRFSTYAIWWIRAAMQDYILRSWSMVRIGTTAAKKKLFFNLQRIKNKLQLINNTSLTPENLRHIADELDVKPEEVEEVNQRIGGDLSLNRPVGEEERQSEWQDMLSDERPNREASFIDEEEEEKRKEILTHALARLDDRERDIVIRRNLSEKAVTLQNLSEDYAVSRERIRQIETRALAKMRAVMTPSLKDIEGDRG